MSIGIMAPSVADLLSLTRKVAPKCYYFPAGNFRYGRPSPASASLIFTPKSLAPRLPALLPLPALLSPDPNINVDAITTFLARELVDASLFARRMAPYESGI